MMQKYDYCTLGMQGTSKSSVLTFPMNFSTELAISCPSFLEHPYMYMFLCMEVYFSQLMNHQIVLRLYQSIEKVRGSYSTDKNVIVRCDVLHPIMLATSLIFWSVAEMAQTTMIFLVGEQ